MNVIKIRGLEISARHGVHDFEKTTFHPFVFDVDIFCDFFAAFKSDDVADTINYSKVCSLISDICKSASYNLLEKLAYECAFAIMERFNLAESVKLTVYKPEAPVKQKFENIGVGVELKRQKAYLSLGSSMGDKWAMLERAVNLLGLTRGVKVEKVSSFIATPPYGGVAKNEFLNCAAEISTFLSAHRLLDEIHAIESKCGRTRDKRWDDRTLDIDIIFFGDERICDSRLIVPHIDYKNRDFVKKPLKEIAPHLFYGDK